ncbi:MAG: DNA repair protein RecO [Verrucomicrobiota bacterium]
MKARGTLIRRSPLTETSLIVHWCTHENGIVKTVAKGARRPKSAFAGKLDLFFLCEVEIHPAKSGELHILKDLKIERARLGLRKNYLQTLAASYFVKLVDRVTELETPLPEIADLLDRGLNYLEENEADWRAIQHFEKQLAEFLGVVEPGIDPIRCLDDIFGKMPEQRNEIEEMLQRRKAT